mmetsp:Transcript_33506/g.83521  ORF Transcript_33506/g.83521 Transcript_33506/m.83521 type:complete len:224 (-) Transcript_33506:769-1440(-)
MRTSWAISSSLSTRRAASSSAPARPCCPSRPTLPQTSPAARRCVRRSTRTRSLPSTSATRVCTSRRSSARSSPPSSSRLASSASRGRGRAGRSPVPTRRTRAAARCATLSLRHFFGVSATPTSPSKTRAAAAPPSPPARTPSRTHTRCSPSPTTWSPPACWAHRSSRCSRMRSLAPSISEGRPDPTLTPRGSASKSTPARRLEGASGTPRCSSAPPRRASGSR